MGTLANNKYPDEILHNVVFHQSLHCLLRQSQSSEKEIHYLFEIITFDPSIYTIDHPDFVVSSFFENSISLNETEGPWV